MTHGGNRVRFSTKRRESAYVTQRRGIRWHLFQVQLVSIVPIGLFAAAMLYLHWQVQENERERSQMESVRLIAAAVDNALDSTVERLSIFARLWSSTDLSEEAIHGQAKEALKANADWRNIVAFGADGHGVFRTDIPFGDPVPASLHPEVYQPVVMRRTSVISDVFYAAATGRALVAVAVPVIHGEVVTHVLIASLDLTWYDRLLTQSGQPDGAVAGLLDRNLKFVARSSEGEMRRGEDPAPGVADDMRANREGLARYVNLNGTPVYNAWTLTRHGWMAGFATPSGPVDNAFWNHLLVFGFVWLAAMSAGVLYAFAKARPIAASLESLEDQAEYFAEGRGITNLPDSRVEEVNRALTALEKASALLQSAMRERDRSLETEREARAVAETANATKDEFLAMLGHELRNPVAAISSAATIVKNRRGTPEQFDFAAGVIERQVTHLKRLIDDLLDVGRVMTGKILLEQRPVDLAASTRGVLATLQTAGRLADRTVDVDATPAWVQADHTRIEQILTNVLVNAVSYTSPGGHIHIRVASEGQNAVVEVKDDGRGIAAEDLGRVFDLFFQGAPSVDRSAGGLGIGLTLVHRLVTLHGGDVTAASPGEGKGATFTLRLPAIAAPQLQAAETAAAPGDRAQTILLVEDNADARESLSVALTLEGYRVLAAADGVAALDIVERERPPLAVLDIGLPRMDGYELARRIREKSGPEIVLIALTGYGSESDTARSANAGFDEHLTKPVDLNELMAVLDEILGDRRGSEVVRT
jgi:signal transduction histidine kinase/ActR/RegA family two-component response regulator